MTRRRWIVVFVLAGALVGHLWYWYVPRERNVSPAMTQLGAGLDRPEISVWVPFPHQNLAMLRRSWPPEGGLVADLTLLATGRDLVGTGTAETWLPPAGELRFDWAPDAWSLGARIYPAVAVAARLLGRAAGNPWVAGGSVDRAGGGRAEVTWDGRAWWFGRETDRDAMGGVHGFRDRAVLGLVTLFEPQGPWPSGAYAIERNGEDLLVALGVAPESSRFELTEGVALRLAGRSAEGPFVMWLAAGAESRSAVPGLAAWTTSGDPGSHLPGGSVLAAAGGLREREAFGGRLAATDTETLELAARELESAPVSALLASGSKLDIVLEVASARELVRDVADLLDSLPLTGAAERRRWSAAARLLEAAGRFDSAAVWIDGAGEAGASLIRR